MTPGRAGCAPGRPRRPSPSRSSSAASTSASPGAWPPKAWKAAPRSTRRTRRSWPSRKRSPPSPNRSPSPWRWVQEEGAGFAAPKIGWHLSVYKERGRYSANYGHGFVWRGRPYKENYGSARPFFPRGGGAREKYGSAPLGRRTQREKYGSAPLGRRTQREKYGSAPLGRRTQREKYGSAPLGRRTQREKYGSAPQGRRTQREKYGSAPLGRVGRDHEGHAVQPPAIQEYFGQHRARTHNPEIKSLMLYPPGFPRLCRQKVPGSFPGSISQQD
uniref:Uncharacterized protein n=1 Tax=Podarcis muralis TaxID=64176 RepID=A0A670JCF6_PODMU